MHNVDQIVNPQISPEEPPHLLLAYAHKYVRDEHDLAPPDCDYDLVIGAWVKQGSDTLFVSMSGVGRPPQSKKSDVETGEDQKGY